MRSIDKKRIEIDSQLKHKVFDDQLNSLDNATQFNFIFPDKSDEAKLAEMKLERELEKILSKQIGVDENTKSSFANKMVASNANDANAINNTKDIEHDIFFEFGSIEITLDKGFTMYVEKLGDFFKQNPGKKVHIIGHTCNIGDSKFNMYLGQKRADAAKAALVQKGIGTFKLITHSRGESLPVFDNSAELGRSKNRRVEIDIM